MSSPGKNRLEYLPSLVQREIIVQLGTKQSLECLFQAYPSMRVHFNHYKTTILRDILQNLIPDDKEENILKDLLIIAEIKTFRLLCRSFSGMLYHRRGQQLLNHPVLGQVAEVHRLLSQNIVLIEDYISKATSKYPPPAYIGLPDLDLGTGSKFKGQSLDTRLVPFTSLRRLERYLDNMFFDAEEYYKDLSVFADYQPTDVDRLACLGSSRLVQIVQILSLSKDQKGDLMDWLRELAGKHRPILPWIYDTNPSNYDMRCSENLWGLEQLWSSSDPDSQSLRPFLAANPRAHGQFGSNGFRSRQKPYMRQIQIYRQRAWGLLDDKRLYANPSRPWPTFEQIKNLERIDKRTVPKKRDFMWLARSNPARYLSLLSKSLERKKRRSQAWQEFWAGDRSHEPFWYLREARPGPARSRESEITWGY